MKGTTGIRGLKRAGLVPAPVLLTFCLLLVRGGDAAPIWDGDPGSQYHLYTFTTDANPMNPEDHRGPGSSGAATIGEFGDGWFDENSSLARTGDSGAWDLGKQGTLDMTFTLGDRASSPGFGGYDVEYEVHAIVRMDSGLWGAPTFQPVGYAAIDAFTMSSELSSPWYTRQWTGRVENVMEDTLQFSLIGHPDNGSFVDQMEFFVIPEPSSLVLMLILAGTAFFAFIYKRGRR